MLPCVACIGELCRGSAVAKERIDKYSKSGAATSSLVGRATDVY